MSAVSRVVIHRSVVRKLSMAATQGPVETQIFKKLAEKFQPNHLEVINESYKHNVPKGSETHFLVVIVSDHFSGLPLIKRHRAVNETLTEELKSCVHALSIQAKTPGQWSKDDSIKKTPPCLGGSGK